ncbi:OX-2 membrane glycoprotein isoform X1 [Paramormyrops kingsleyae]|uniref:OX-2 membrane glycoprotein isoform X1 n=1 Tax=Paramormyrops kingsleyae TaxID=1676925 RepID=UPI003B9793DF
MDVSGATMSKSPVRRCLQLSLLLLMVSPLQGKVSAQPHVQVLVGLPATLRCNLALSGSEVLKQVRWVDGRNVTVLSYVSRHSVSAVEPERVTLTSATRDSSAITISMAGPRDEGCYTCIFDVYPTGPQEAQTCLVLTAKVTPDGNHTAVSGRQATLACRYGLARRVQQVQWMKAGERGDSSDVASFNKHGEPIILDALLGRISLSRTLDESRLFFRPVRTEDEGCYTCEFHAYPEGVRSAVVCLTVYVLPKPQITHKTTSPGVIEANCSAVARPAAMIAWNVEGNNKTLGPASVLSLQQDDGTTLVISTLSLRSDLLHDRSIKCLVHHRGLESAISVPLNTKMGEAVTILILVISLAVMLLVCLCICLWKCFLRKD